MPQFLFLKNNPTALQNLKSDWNTSLFYQQKYIENQYLETLYTFALADEKLQAVFYLQVENGGGFSPQRASYGSVETDGQMNEETIHDFIKQSVEVCKKKGLKYISIKHFPDCYAPTNTELVEKVLLKNGFTIIQNTDNQFIELPFLEQLHSSEKRRLKKCLRAGFEFSEWQNPNPETIYEFIENNRRQLGYSLSFGLDELKNWLSIFPENYKVFCVNDQSKIIAISLCVKVREDVLYNFCPADDLNYRSYSPAVLLHQGLCAYCQQHNIRILDLGVSLDADGQPKPSLIRFKEHLGAKICQKKIFFLDL